MLPLKSSILQRGPDGLPKRSELRWVDQQSEEIASEVQAAKPLSSTLVFRQDCPSLAIREPDKYDLYEGGLSPASLAGKAPNIGATPETTATAEVSSPQSPIVVARFMRHPLGARMQPIPHRISPTAPPTPTKTRSIHGGSVLFEKTSEMILSSRFVSSGQTTSSSAMSMTIASTTTTTKTTATSASIVQQLSKRQQATYLAPHALHDQEQAHITAAPGKVLLSTSTLSSSTRSLRSSGLNPPSSSLPLPICARQNESAMTKEQEDTLMMVLKNEGKKRPSSKLLPSQQPMSPPRSPLAPRNAPSSPQKRIQVAITSSEFIDRTHETEMELDDEYEEHALPTINAESRSSLPLPTAVFQTPISATASASSSYVTSALKNQVASALGIAAKSDASKVLALVIDTDPLPQLPPGHGSSSSSSPWGLVNEEFGVTTEKPFERPSMRKHTNVSNPASLLLQKKNENVEQAEEEEEGGGEDEKNVEETRRRLISKTEDKKIEKEEYVLEQRTTSEDVLFSERKDEPLLPLVYNSVNASFKLETDHINERLMIEEEEEKEAVIVHQPRTQRSAVVTAVGSLDASKSRKRPLSPPLDKIKIVKRTEQPPILPLQAAAVKRTTTTTMKKKKKKAAKLPTLTVAQSSSALVEEESEPLVNPNPIDSAHFLELRADLEKHLAKSDRLRQEPVLPPLDLYKFLPQPSFQAVLPNPKGLCGNPEKWSKTVAAKIKRENAVPDNRPEDCSDHDSESEKQVRRFNKSDYSSSLQTLHNMFLEDDMNSKDAIASEIEMVVISSDELKAVRRGKRPVVVASSTEEIELPMREEAYFGKVRNTRYCSRYPICNPRARSASRDTSGKSSLQQLKKPSNNATVNEAHSIEEEEGEEKEDEEKEVMKPTKSNKKQMSKAQEIVKKPEVLSLGLRLTIADARRKREEEGKRDAPPDVADMDLSFKGSGGEDLKPRERRVTTRSSVPPAAAFVGETKKALVKLFDAEKTS
jgi:hypothetical protein